MKKTILVYGLISGLVASVLMVASALHTHNSMDFSNGELIGYAGILLSMVVVFFGVRSYRDNVAGGSISFGQAFKVGILMTLISCLCYVVAWMIVSETILPNFMEKYIEYSLNQLQQSGASEAHIQQEALKMEQYKAWYQNPFLRAAMTFMEPLPVGLLVTLVTSFILRRRSS